MQDRITSQITVTDVDRELPLMGWYGLQKYGLITIQRKVSFKGGGNVNRSKIEWCDHTWNPITGCLHGCEYCYAKSMVKRFSGEVRMNKMARDDYRLEVLENGTELYVLDREMIGENGKIIVYPFGFEPTFHRYRLNTPGELKMGNNIFVGAMSDLFGNWVPDSWLDEIFEACEKYPEHNYLFLTKNVDRYCNYGVPAEGHDNYWYGTTITRESEIHRFDSLPAYGKQFISFEPILEDLHPDMHRELFETVDWIILGAETGRRKTKVEAKFEWIKKLVLMADANGVPVFMKDSLIPVVGEENMRREFPKELMEKTISEKMQNKLYDVCAECEKVELKRDMAAMIARFGKKGLPKQFAFLCMDCFEKQCKKWAVEIPTFERRNGGLEHGKHHD